MGGGKGEAGAQPPFLILGLRRAISFSSRDSKPEAGAAL